MIKHVEGYTEDGIDICPFCGGYVGSYYSDGSLGCEECGKKFFVILKESEADTE